MLVYKACSEMISSVSLVEGGILTLTPAYGWITRCRVGFCMQRRVYESITLGSDRVYLLTDIHIYYRARI